MGWPKIALDGHSNANQGQLMDNHGDTLKLDCLSHRMDRIEWGHITHLRERRENQKISEHLMGTTSAI